MTAQQLKNSILQMAVQGKLVPQDSNDEPASVLLERIRAEKQALIKAGKIKKEKPQAPITEDEIPFDIPDTWTWGKFGECGVLKSGFAFKSQDYITEGVQVVRISDLSEDGISNNDAVYYKEDVNIEQYLITPNSFLICLTGSIGKMAWVRDDIPRYLNQRVGMFEPLDCCCTEYLWWYLHTGYVINLWVGAKTSTNGNIKNSDVTDLLIPLPPLSEQYRIVAKIEELLPYIEKYGKAEEHLTALNTTFPEALKKSILQEAVQGKLIPQDPNDEPASMLLERIGIKIFEDNKLGKNNNGTILSQIPPDDVPFELPESWCWCRLIDLIQDKPSNGLSPKGVDYETAIKNLTLTATSYGVFKKDAFKYVDISQDEAEKYWLKNDDLLIQRSNSRELVGTSCVYTGDDNMYIYPDLMMRIHMKKGINVKYIDYVLKSPFVRKYYSQSASGTSSSMPKINQKIVSMTLIPLPSENEQKRIVERIEEIMPIINKA